MEALGSEVHVDHRRVASRRGLLGARIDYVRALCASDDRYVWLDQYTQPEQLAGALPQHGTGDRPPVPASSTCCSSGPAPPGP